jgi:hypothetical protein
MLGRRNLAALIAIACAGLATVGGVATLATAAQVGTLNLNATLRVQGVLVACPPGTPALTNCYRVGGDGSVPGLGRVSQSTALQWEGCPSLDTFRGTDFDGQLTVAGKGTIDVTVDVPDGTCLTITEIFALSRPFIVKGGTGVYVGATGSGTLSRQLDGTSQGTDTWNGTLSVPGVEFDLTAPTIRGATSKTVRAKKGAKRARVTYAVTAQDDRDGSVPAACTPRSGGFFPLGSRRVTCTATDASGNTQTATFTVRVLRAKR